MIKSKKQPHASVCAFQKAKRCGAKTRKGVRCKSPVVRGKNRCRMHGGAKGSGAPIGNQNALKHGFYTKESLDLIKEIKNLLRLTENTLSYLNHENLK